jgi:hypothetical protein
MKGRRTNTDPSDHHDHRLHRLPALGILLPHRLARILVRPALALLGCNRDVRALPAHERLHKGPLVLQYVADGGLPDELWRCRGAVRTGVFRGDNQRGCAEEGAGVDGRCWRTVFQRFCAVRWDGYRGMLTSRLIEWKREEGEGLTPAGIPLRPRRPLLERVASRSLVVAVHC